LSPRLSRSQIGSRLGSPHHGRRGERVSPLALELIALVAAGVFLLWTTRGLTFLQDEWDFVQGRLDWNADTFLLPNNQHLLLLDVLIYKLLFVTFGIGEYLPYRVMSVLVHLSVVALLFGFVRGRIGRAAAVAVAAPVLFLGCGWFVVLNPFNVQWTLSLAALIPILLLLERPSRRHDLAVCILLIAAIAASSLGVAMAVGVLIAVVWRRDEWRRLWVVLVPLALYGLWFLHYGVNAAKRPDYRLTFHPGYLFDLAAGGVGGILGLPLGGEAVAERPYVSHAVHLLTLALGVGLMVELLRRRHRLPMQLIVLVTTLVLLWLSVTISRGYGNTPYGTQYIYVSVVLIALIGVELIGIRILPVPGVAAIVLIMSTSTVLNLATLRHYANLRREEASRVTAAVTALEIARKHVDPQFRPDDDPEGAPQILAITYFSAVDRLGSSPALTPARLVELPEVARAKADEVLMRTLGLHLTPYTRNARRFLAAAGQPAVGQRCRRLAPGSSDHAVLERPLGAGTVVDPRGHSQAELRLRRFASAFPREPSAVVARKTLVTAPLGAATRPWRLQVSSRAAVAVC
jgi:hypothetical protein